MMRIWIWLVMVLAAGAALAQVAVENTDGQVVVRVDAARVAAWRLDARHLAVVAADAAEPEVAALPEGWQAEKVGGGELRGVVLEGPVGSWEVMQDGGRWLLRQGKNTVPGASALLLRDGWRVGGEVVKPARVTVGGEAWDVGLVDRPLSVGGSVVGVVRKARDLQPAQAAAEVPAEPAAPAAPKEPAKPAAPASAHAAEQVVDVAVVAKVPGALVVIPTSVSVAVKVSDSSGMQVVSVSQLMGRIEDSENTTAAAPLAMPTGLVTAEADTPSEVVPVHAAEALAPVMLPQAASEILPRVLGEVYVPGTVVSLSVPGVEALAPVSGSVMQLPATLPVNEPELREADVGEAAAERLFPAMGGNYTDALSDVMQAVVEAPEGTERWRSGEVALAGFYLAWQRPEEALAVVSGLPQRKDGLPANPLARLYYGLAKLARGEDGSEAFDQGGALAADAKLWHAVAASQMEDYATALRQWPKERGILPQYPAYLRELAQLAQARALVMAGDKNIATKVVDKLAEAYAGGAGRQVPAELLRLRGLVRLGTPEESLGLDYLAKAAADREDLASAYRAKYEFVRALQQRHDLSDAQVRKYLADLWLDWRGDSLERDVLRTLADLSDKNGQPRDALQYWQVLVQAYPHAPDLNAVTERMTEAFLRVFDPETAGTYDVLSYLGMYYDFRELVPNDVRGDAVQEQVARMLGDVTLWDRAVPILEQQLQYRPLDSASQGRLALMLAEDYRQMGKGGEALKVLDKWQKVATTTVLSRGWKLAEARLLLELDRPAAARKTVETLPADDVDARDVRITAAWRERNWKLAVPLLQDRLAKVTGNGLVEDSGAQLALFQLAYAYGQQKDGPGLDELTKRYAEVLPKLPQLADDMGVVAASTGVSATLVAGGPLSPLTRGLSDLNRLTERIMAQRAELQAAAAKQQEYNDKMKYMELLPPPAL